MRLVSWNCCNGFSRKMSHLQELAPDTAVISEVRRDCLHKVGLLERSMWVGDPGKKGLAIIPFGDWRITASGPRITDKWFAPVIVESSVRALQLVGVWLHDVGGYVRPTLRALQALAPFLAAGPTVLAGDFNQSVSFDAKAGPGNRFAEVLAVLRSAELSSAWHDRTGEEHGSETKASLYFRRSESSPHHIDFAFYPRGALSVTSARLGSFDEYVATKLSDHVPLVVDFSWS